jgi:hypothetical protein
MGRVWALAIDCVDADSRDLVLAYDFSIVALL